MAEGNTRSLLFMDDEVIFVTAMSKVLTRRGVKVHSAEDAESARKILREQDPDVVVLGISNLPETNLTALAEIRREKPLTPVIVLTGPKTVDAGMEALKMGAFDLLPKPVPVAKLLEIVDEAAHSRGLAEQADRSAGSPKGARRA